MRGKVKEVVVEKKSKKVVCVQKPKQFFFTIPHCKNGSVGGYCTIMMSSSKKSKSCRNVHLTVNDLKKNK